MLLQRGIQVFYRDAELARDSTRLWLSTGTAIASLSAPMYRDDAYLPQAPWREPSVEERALLHTKSKPCDPGTSISIFQLPGQVLAPLKALGLTTATDEAQVETLEGHRNFRAAMAHVLDYLTQFFYSREQLTFSPLTTNAPGLPTVTFDYRNNCYIGLHLDSWDRRPLKDRQNSTTRICVNMGSEDRYLLFINLPLKTMFTLLYPEMDISHFQHGHGESHLGATFMAHYPLYPVVKLRIAPGEAYLGPTENMIHDASTLGKSRIDIILTIRGYLGMP